MSERLAVTLCPLETKWGEYVLSSIGRYPTREENLSQQAYRMLLSPKKKNSFDVGIEQDAYVLLGGSMQSKEMTYVQLSRARGESHLFSDVQDGAELERLLRRSEEKRSAHGVASERGWIEKETGQKESQEQAQALELAM